MKTMKLKDAVKFVCYKDCPCYDYDTEHFAKVISKDGTSEEMFFNFSETRKILEKYGNKDVLKVNVDVQIKSDHELIDDIIFEFYLDI